MKDNMSKVMLAEMFGTFWLVLGGCGSAVLAAGVPDLGIGFVGVSLAFGLTVVTMGYAVGHISGGHFNPAVSLGLWAAGRFPVQYLPGYIISQVIGGGLGAGVLYLVASGIPEFDVHAGFASNGFGLNSPGGYPLMPVIAIEVVLTAVFVMVITGVTSQRAPMGFAPLVTGLCLTLIHLISIPVDNTSVNPARSTAVALFAGGGFISQLWVFWLAPLAGGLLGGVLGKVLFSAKQRG